MSQAERAHSSCNTLAGLSALIVIGIVVLGASAAQAQTFTTLCSFNDGNNTGGNVSGQPIVDSSGKVFGTASTGGGSLYGTLWLFGSGTLSTLYAFTYSNGANPFAGLTFGKDNELVGTTENGGSHGAGTVFYLENGVLNVAYNFGSATGDPLFPYSGVVVKGNSLYGTSIDGGTYGFGTVWKVNIKTGKEWVLHSFAGGRDGGNPYQGTMYRDSDGDLFGVAESYGAYGCGTLFRLHAEHSFQVLHSFTCGKDGGFPSGTIAAQDGILYGTAQAHGASGHGTAWQYNISNRKFTLLHSFSGRDGSDPVGGVTCQLQNSGGCKAGLFGTTASGGASGNGTVWEITSSRIFTTLHSFDGSDGAEPYANPFVDANGDIYGTTFLGGTAGDGTLWEITFP